MQRACPGTDQLTSIGVQVVEEVLGRDNANAVVAATWLNDIRTDDRRRSLTREGMVWSASALRPWIAKWNRWRRRSLMFLILSKKRARYLSCGTDTDTEETARNRLWSDRRL